MAMVQSNLSPGNRVEVGDAIVAASKTISMGKLKVRFKAFVAAHSAFSAAEAAVRKADDRLRARQGVVGAADAVQDAEVEGLAGALAGDGYARNNPFKVMGFASPSEVANLGYAEEAKTVRKLVAAVRKRKDVSADTLKAALRAERAAAAVEKALKPIKALEAARKKAMTARDALEQAWETQFAGLKLAARLADADGDGRALDALFVQPAAAAAPKRRSKAKPAAPAPAPV